MYICIYIYIYVYMYIYVFTHMLIIIFDYILILIKSAEEGTSRMAWIECDDIVESYPALGELVQQLHALPYEINAKSNCALRLLQPALGCTMIVHFSAGNFIYIHIYMHIEVYFSSDYNIFICINIYVYLIVHKYYNLH
jgi:hypothetical protein